MIKKRQNSNMKGPGIFCLFCTVMAVLISSVPQPASAGNEATHNIVFEIPNVSTITVSGNPGKLEAFISRNQNSPGIARDASTTYSFTCNSRNKKITASLNENPPPSTTLSVSLASPPGATSLGEVPLSTSPRVLVTGVGNMHAKNLPITYKFSASPDAGRVQMAPRFVTFTLSGE